jgi:2-succinyl-5-enolpyruvyl-6-hydroxy-3-cyclohexene-1-carboxylate synthase
MADAPISSADVQATFCATLVDEWARLGVTTAFVAPGSRSTPLVLALANDDRIRMHVFHDERSAAFAALGAGLRSGQPSVLVCTSGTAATHFHAAVVEADLAGVPLVVVTADRPPELQGVGAPQTIRQDHLYGAAAHWFHDPGVPRADESATWRSVARRSLEEALRQPHGPVHVNLPFREPLVGTSGSLPPFVDEVLDTRAERGLDTAVRRRLAETWSVRRPLLVAGRGTPDALVEAAQRRGWPVFAESRVRSVNSVVTHFDSLLRHAPFADVDVPELVVRVGDPPASKVLGQWLVRHEVPQYHVSPDGRIYDPDRAIVERVVCDPGEIAAMFEADIEPADTAWTRRWSSAEANARVAVSNALLATGPMAGVHAVVTFGRSLPDDAAIVVSSSMPIRDLEWFSGPLGSRKVFSNRGANGIDGVVATAIGVAARHDGPVGVIVGDVAAIHDSSSLAALARRGLDVRILVVDNDGGGIFHHLPQRTILSDVVFELLYGTPHGTDFVTLAAAHGIDGRAVEDRQALESAAHRPGPSLTVVRTDREGDVAAHRTLHAAVAETLAD